MNDSNRIEVLNKNTEMNIRIVKYSNSLDFSYRDGWGDQNFRTKKSSLREGIDEFCSKIYGNDISKDFFKREDEFDGEKIEFMENLLEKNKSITQGHVYNKKNPVILNSGGTVSYGYDYSSALDNFEIKYIIQGVIFLKGEKDETNKT